MAVIEIDKLTHDYRVGFWRRRPWRALAEVSLSVEAGEVLALLGPNGAGKTTIFRILIGLIRPTAGSVRILGRDCDDPRWKVSLGYLPEHPSFYDYLTAREFLIYGAELSGMPGGLARSRADDLLQRVGLADDADRPLRKFSKGMLQRAGLAQALINDPKILFLDEPMSGLDPLGRRLVRDLVNEGRAAGKTIVFSSHILTDVETLCDRVAVLHRGRLIESGKLSEILSAHGRELEVVVMGIDEGAFRRLRDLAAEIEATPEGARLRLLDDRPLPQVIEIVQRANGRLLSVNPLRPSLEDWFLRELRRDPIGALRHE